MKEKLHIANFVRDDKFIDSLIKFQDLSSEECVHDYIIVSKKTILYKSIKSTNRIKVVPASMILQFIKENNYNAVFLHSLVCMPYYYISQIHREIPVFWFAWGFDIYGYLIKVKRLHLRTILCKYTFFLKDLITEVLQLSLFRLSYHLKEIRLRLLRVKNY